MNGNKMICVILCGGSGSRLWPLSREEQPKQFLTLPDGQSFIQKTYNRALNLPKTEQLVTVTNKNFYFQILDELKKVGAKNQEHLCLLEPFGRNTAPAVAAAAFELSNRFSLDTPLLVMPSDHIIEDEAIFSEAVEEALKLAEKDLLVTFGIKPTRPETGFGYMEVSGLNVKKFVEKPDLNTAKQYMENENFYWNSGIFCFNIRSILKEFSTYSNDLLINIQKCLLNSNRSTKDLEIINLDSKIFGDCKNISIDHAIIEKSTRIAAVLKDFHWNDMGSWTELCSLNESDSNGNHVVGETILEKTYNCDIIGGDRLISTIGLNDVLVVDTPDALLVAKKDQVHEVKTIYNRLKSENNDKYKVHTTIFRPWGSFTLLETGPRYKIKKLEIKPGASISLQLHYHRNEHWTIVSGTAVIEIDDKIHILTPSESIYVKAGMKHRLNNKGLINLVVIEVQTGDYFGEDDIVRFKDVYDRL
jgi:mannose-1-phosphate guanylyltransferase